MKSKNKSHAKLITMAKAVLDLKDSKRILLDAADLLLKSEDDDDLLDANDDDSLSAKIETKSSNKKHGHSKKQTRGALAQK